MSFADAVVERWNTVWFSEGNPFTLAVFRILIAVCLGLEVGTSRYQSVFALEGGFHLPYLGWVPLLDEATYATVHRFQYVLIVLLAAGIATRVAGTSLLVLQGWVFFADRMNFRNHPYFFLLVLALLMVSPCDDTLSVKSWLGGRRTLAEMLRPPSRLLTAQRLLQLQVTIVYVYAALMKINPQYLSGAVLAQQASSWLGRSGDAAGEIDAGASLLTGGPAEPAIWVALSWASILLELFLGTALWSSRRRIPAMVVGAAFHITLAVLMGVWEFSLAYLGTYLLFLDPDTLPRAIERVTADRSLADAA